MTERSLPQYDHDGRSLTVAEWATVTGIRSYDISTRLRQGWTIARIIAEVKPTSTPCELTHPTPAVVIEKPVPQQWATRLFTHDGETMDLKAWSAKSGIPFELLKSRLRSGWGLHRALAYPAGGAPQVIDHGTAVRTITFDGLTLTVKQWAKRAGITPTTLKWRLDRWPLAKALTTSSRKGLAITRQVHGASMTLKEASAKAGIAYSTVVTRLRSGWTLDDALSVPPRSIMGENSHSSRRRNASTQPMGAMSEPQPGGGSATFEGLRGPAGDQPLNSASN